MKIHSETRAIEKLHELKTEFARRIREEYEHRAKSCSICETPGACCLDAHFVNVRITRLEAKAIGEVIGRLPKQKQIEVLERVESTIAIYDLSSTGDTFAKTYACPLFEKGTGCLVHGEAKPLPCIAHACYENREDLPPDELVTDEEARIGKLNEIIYRRSATWLPLPVAVGLAVSRSQTDKAMTDDSWTG